MIELLVGLAVAGLLLGAGVPAAGSLLAAQEVRSAHSRLFSHLAMARTMAVSSAYQTIICPSNDGQQCSGSTHWGRGWMSFLDTDASRSRNPGEPILAVGKLPSAISVQTSRARRAVRFLPSGGSPGSNLTFQICHNAGATPRAIILSNTGRARSSLTRANGDPLICA